MEDKMKPVGFLGIALVGLGALLILTRKKVPPEGIPKEEELPPLTIVPGPEGEPMATPPAGVTPTIFDWMGNPYPDTESMVYCINTYGPAAGGTPETLAQCSIRSWG